MLNEQLLNDIHSLNVISPGCPEWGEINISIPSVVVLWMCFSEICVCVCAWQGFTHLSGIEEQIRSNPQAVF